MNSQLLTPLWNHWILGVGQFGCSSFAASSMYSLLYLDLTLIIDRKYWISLFYHIEQIGFSLPHNGTRKSDDKGGMTLNIIVFMFPHLHISPSCCCKVSLIGWSPGVTKSLQFW